MLATSIELTSSLITFNKFVKLRAAVGFKKKKCSKIIKINGRKVFKFDFHFLNLTVVPSCLWLS